MKGKSRSIAFVLPNWTDGAQQRTGPDVVNPTLATLDFLKSPIFIAFRSSFIHDFCFLPSPPSFPFPSVSPSTFFPLYIPFPLSPPPVKLPLFIPVHHFFEKKLKKIWPYQKNAVPLHPHLRHHLHLLQ